ncbi:MAG: PfkB family carbohydrate kinase [Candidatus Altiarchaeota archaeon]|nr:PfkB family carbohydrate kinase [Candidatus Altiarchaeota archaeon]
MNLVALGTIALDSVETPFGKVKDVLGGSVTYFSLASRVFSKCGVIGVVGKDFPVEHLKLLEDHGIDVAGVEFAEGKTFRWSGYYEYDMNRAHTIKTDLNVLASFKPKIPKDYRKCDFLFLANTDPEIQLDVLDEVKPKYSVCDTMNFWIQNKKEKVGEVFRECDMIIINEGEARQYCDTPNLIKAGRELLDTADRVIIKKGEHGALYFSDNCFFTTPAFPLENLKDPTGAGDSFAGGTMGYLAATKDMKDANVKKAMVYGSVIASYVVEDFSIEGLKKISKEKVRERYSMLKEIVAFEHEY